METLSAKLVGGCPEHIEGFSASFLDQRSSWLPWAGAGGSHVPWGVAPRAQNRNLTKAGPSKPSLPLSHIPPPSSAFSMNAWREMRFELPPKEGVLKCILRPAQLLPFLKSLCCWGFRVNIQGTFHPESPAVMGVLGFQKDYQPQAGKGKRLQVPPLLPNRRAHCPRPLASQGLLTHSSTARR